MYKTLQVLRTKVPLKATTGQQVNPKTRVVVMSMVDDEHVKVKVVDPKFPDLNKMRLTAGINAFHATRRGRPKKETV